MDTCQLCNKFFQPASKNTVMRVWLGNTYTNDGFLVCPDCYSAAVKKNMEEQIKKTTVLKFRKCSNCERCAMHNNMKKELFRSLHLMRGF